VDKLVNRVSRVNQDKPVNKDQLVLADHKVKLEQLDQ
jgi:hypothetical protein